MIDPPKQPFYLSSSRLSSSAATRPSLSPYISTISTRCTITPLSTRPSSVPVGDASLCKQNGALKFLSTRSISPTNLGLSTSTLHGRDGDDFSTSVPLLSTPPAVASNNRFQDFTSPPNSSHQSQPVYEDDAPVFQFYESGDPLSFLPMLPPSHDNSIQIDNSGISRSTPGPVTCYSQERHLQESTPSTSLLSSNFHNPPCSSNSVSLSTLTQSCYTVAVRSPRPFARCDNSCNLVGSSGIRFTPACVPVLPDEQVQSADVIVTLMDEDGLIFCHSRVHTNQASFSTNLNHLRFTRWSDYVLESDKDIWDDHFKRAVEASRVCRIRGQSESLGSPFATSGCQFTTTEDIVTLSTPHLLEFPVYRVELFGQIFRVRTICRPTDLTQSTFDDTWVTTTSSPVNQPLEYVPNGCLIAFYHTFLQNPDSPHSTIASLSRTDLRPRNGLDVSCSSRIPPAISDDTSIGCTPPNSSSYFSSVSHTDPFDDHMLGGLCEHIQTGVNYHTSSPSVTYHHRHHHLHYDNLVRSSGSTLDHTFTSPARPLASESDQLDGDHTTDARDFTNSGPCFVSEPTDLNLKRCQHRRSHLHHHHVHLHAAHLHHHHRHRGGINNTDTIAHEPNRNLEFANPLSLSPSHAVLRNSAKPAFLDTDVGHAGSSTGMNTSMDPSISPHRLDATAINTCFHNFAPPLYVNRVNHDTSANLSTSTHPTQSSSVVTVRSSVLADSAYRRQPTSPRASGSKKEHGERIMLLQNLLPLEAVKQIRHIWQEIYRNNEKRIPVSRSDMLITSPEPSAPSVINITTAAKLDATLREQFARRVRQVVRQYLGPNALRNTNHFVTQLPYKSPVADPLVTEAPRPSSTIVTQTTNATSVFKRRSSGEGSSETNAISSMNHPLSFTASSNMAMAPQEWTLPHSSSGPNTVEDLVSQEQRTLLSTPSQITPSNLMDPRDCLSTSSLAPDSVTLVGALNSSTQLPAPPNTCLADLKTTQRTSGGSKCCMLEWLLSEEADLCLLPASFFESRSSSSHTFSSTFAPASLDYTSVDTVAGTQVIQKSCTAEPSSSSNFTSPREPSGQLLSVQVPTSASCHDQSMSPTTLTNSTDGTLPISSSPTATIAYPPSITRGYERLLTGCSPALSPSVTRFPGSVGSIPPPSPSKANSLLVRLLHPSTSIPAPQNSCTKCRPKSATHSEPSSPCIGPPEFALHQSSGSGQSNHSPLSVSLRDTAQFNTSSLETQPSLITAVVTSLASPANNKAKRRRSGPPTPQSNAVASVSTLTRTRHVSSQIERIGVGGRNHCTPALTQSPPITSLTQLLLQDFPSTNTSDSSEYELNGHIHITNPANSTTVPSIVSVSSCNIGAHSQQLVGLSNGMTSNFSTPVWSIPSLPTTASAGHYSASNRVFPIPHPSATSSVIPTNISLTSPILAPTERHLVEPVSPSVSSAIPSSRVPLFPSSLSTVVSVTTKSVPSSQTLSSGHSTSNSSSLCRLLLDPCLGSQDSLEQKTVSTSPLTVQGMPLKKSKTNFFPILQSSAPTLNSSSHDIYEFSTDSTDSGVIPHARSAESLSVPVLPASYPSGPPLLKQMYTSLSTDPSSSAGNVLGSDMYQSCASSIAGPCLSPKAIAEEVEFLYEILRRDEMERSQEATSCLREPTSNNYSPKSKRSRLEFRTTPLNHSSKDCSDNSLSKMTDSTASSQVDAQAVARICEQLQEGFTSRQSVLSHGVNLSAYDNFSQVIGPNRLPTPTFVGLKSGSPRAGSPVNHVESTELLGGHRSFPPITESHLTQSVSRPLVIPRSLNKGAVATARAIQQAAASQRRNMTSQRLLIEQRTRLLQHQLYNQVTVYSANAKSPEVVISPPLILSPGVHSRRPVSQNHLQSPSAERCLSSRGCSSPTVRPFRRNGYSSSSADCLPHQNSVPNSAHNFTATTVVAFSPATLTSSSADSRHYQHRPEDLMRFLKEVGPNVQVQLSSVASESSMSAIQKSKRSSFLPNHHIPASGIHCLDNPSQCCQTNTRTTCSVLSSSSSRSLFGSSISTTAVLPSASESSRSAVASRILSSSVYDNALVYSFPMQAKIADPNNVELNFHRDGSQLSVKTSALEMPTTTLSTPGYMASTTVSPDPTQSLRMVSRAHYKQTHPCVASKAPRTILIDAKLHTNQSTTPHRLERELPTSQSYSSYLEPYWSRMQDRDLTNPIEANAYQMLDSPTCAVHHVPTTVGQVHSSMYSSRRVNPIQSDASRPMGPAISSPPISHAVFVPSLSLSSESSMHVPSATVNTVVHPTRPPHAFVASPHYIASSQTLLPAESNRTSQNASFSPTIVASLESVGQSPDGFGQCDLVADSITQPDASSQGSGLSHPTSNQPNCVLELDTKQEESLLPEDIINDVFDLETMVAAKQQLRQSYPGASKSQRLFFNDSRSRFPESAYSEYGIDSIEVNVCPTLTTFPSPGSSSPSPCSPHLCSILPVDTRSSYMLP